MQRYAAQIQHVEYVRVAHLMRDGEADNVRLAQRQIGFQGGQVRAALFQDVCSLKIGLIAAFCPPCGVVVENAVQNL